MRGQILIGLLLAAASILGASLLVFIASNFIKTTISNILVPLAYLAGLSLIGFIVYKFVLKPEKVDNLNLGIAFFSTIIIIGIMLFASGSFTSVFPGAVSVPSTAAISAGQNGAPVQFNNQIYNNLVAALWIFVAVTISFAVFEPSDFKKVANDLEKTIEAL